MVGAGGQPGRRPEPRRAVGGVSESAHLMGMRGDSFSDLTSPPSPVSVPREAGRREEELHKSSFNAPGHRACWDLSADRGVSSLAALVWPPAPEGPSSWKSRPPCGSTRGVAGSE